MHVPISNLQAQSQTVRSSVVGITAIPGHIVAVQPLGTTGSNESPALTRRHANARSIAREATATRGPTGIVATLGAGLAGDAPAASSVLVLEEAGSWAAIEIRAARRVGDAALVVGTRSIFEAAWLLAGCEGCEARCCEGEGENVSRQHG